MKELLIPNGYFHLWRNYMATQGFDGVLFAESLNLKKELEHILIAPIVGQSSYLMFKKLILHSQQQLNQPHLIFEMAREVKPEHFGVVGYMTTRSESVAEALQYILKFSRLVIDGDEIIPMQMHQRDQSLFLTWPFVKDDYTLINELTNALMLSQARKIVPLEQFPLQCIALAHAPQMAIYHYQKFYGCDVLFEQPEYSWQFSSASLSLKIQHADPSLLQMLVKQAEEAIASKLNHENLAQQLHLIVAEYLRIQHQAPKMDDIAKELNMSARTLQRQLSNLDTSFKKILEIERMKYAEKLLQNKLSLSDIANELGYSDQSALARAYKAYRGKTLLQAKRDIQHAADL